MPVAIFFVALYSHSSKTIPMIKKNINYDSDN